MRLITWIRQYFCKHKFRKYWSKERQEYIRKCMKCGKENILVS